MSPTKPHLHVLILLVCSYSIDAGAKHNTTVSCFPDHASSLLQLKHSFFYVDAKLASWQVGKDCCHWVGVTCDVATGGVVSLDLGGFHMLSHRLHPALFNLTSLRNLSLADNDFGYAELPSYEFEGLTDVIHLNFSATKFLGQIPIGVSRLKNLVTLDFSGNYKLYLYEPNFQTFMANMSKLRELYLDFVDISSSGSTWSIGLADSVHRLQTLSLFACGISGPIHHSFSRLSSLTAINLSANKLTGKVPQFFAKYSSLNILDISYNSFEGRFPTKIFHMRSLRTLDLSGNHALFVCLPEFTNGNNLQTLNLAGTNLSCDILNLLTNLKSLVTLGLSTTRISKRLTLIRKLPSLSNLQLYGQGFEKAVFSWIGNLNQLTSLDLEGYDFSQSVPSWIGNLTSLERLDIWECNFLGSIPYQVGHLANLTRLSFINCNFSGPIPSTLGNLSRLETLRIVYGNLSGKIPKQLFDLPVLQTLDLSSNQLSGALEDILAPLSSSLSFIWLDNNQITGTIPESFFHLRNLKYLHLGSNRLSGTIELGSFWRLKSLILLILSNNMLSIMDDDDKILPSVPNLAHLGLASCSLTRIPRALRYVDKLLILDLSKNQINGVIPSWVWENWKDSLTYLNLSHNMFATLERPPSLIHMPYLSVFDLSFNRLQGSIPIPVMLHFSLLFKSYYEVVLDYSNNNFSSIVANFGKYVKNVTYLNLSNNKLNGHIPSSICNASKLSMIDLSYNNFSGSIPSCLIQSGKLNILKLRENQFQGTLPENIVEECKFQTLDLNGNRIVGKIPKSLSNCQGLELLDVGNNQIVDYFPSWLGVLPRLRVLVLKSNNLKGTIRGIKGDHSTKNHFRSLQILDLGSNNFSGNLPAEGLFSELKAMMVDALDEGKVLGSDINMTDGFYRDTITITFKGFEVIFTKILTAFKAIDLSNNSFDGPIPDSIGRLVLLHGLNISHNNFTGQIPWQFSNLSQLESLDLSWNQLSWEIPLQLTSLTYLACLNLSYNNLTGTIPKANQFLSFSNSSFEGNAGLCGIPLSKQCDALSSIAPNALTPLGPDNLWQDKLGVILLFAFVGLGFGVGFAMSFMLRLFCHIEG